MTSKSSSVFAVVETMTRAGATAAAESHGFYTTFASVHEQVRTRSQCVSGSVSFRWMWGWRGRERVGQTKGTWLRPTAPLFFRVIFLASVQTDHHCQQRFDHAFKTAVVAFLDQWEAELEAADAVATAAERQCAEVEHYSAKVLGLHEAARAQTSKGRTVSSANATRLQRNEAKFEECKSTFGAARDAALTATHK